MKLNEKKKLNDGATLLLHLDAKSVHVANVKTVVHILSSYTVTMI